MLNKNKIKMRTFSYLIQKNNIYRLKQKSTYIINMANNFVQTIFKVLNENKILFFYVYIFTIRTEVYK